MGRPSLQIDSCGCGTLMVTHTHTESASTLKALQPRRHFTHDWSLTSAASQWFLGSEEQQELLKMKAIPVALLLLVLVAAASSFKHLAEAAGNFSPPNLTEPLQGEILSPFCKYLTTPCVCIADGGAVPDGVCDGKCRSRCSLKKAGRCMGLCMMCCGKCQGCVPSGPYASKDECPCYRDMKSPKNQRPKCP